MLYDIEHLAGAGAILPTEIKAAMQSSLVALKHAERFSSLQFWGKITGVVRDYYIAQASHDSPIVGKKSFYRYGCAANAALGCLVAFFAYSISLRSLDCVKWAQLPSVPTAFAVAASKIRSRFTGNPSHEYTVIESYPGNAPDVPEEVRVAINPNHRTFHVSHMR